MNAVGNVVVVVALTAGVEVICYEYMNTVDNLVVVVTLTTGVVVTCCEYS